MIITLTDENFEKEIQSTNKPILVDFFASWCAPCFVLTPILEKLAEEMKEKIILSKVNLDEVPFVAQKYGINVIPTVILFKEGKPVSGFVGLQPEPVIKEWLKNMLKDDEKEKIEKLIQEYEDYAKENNFSLNPNKEVVERISKGLLENEKKYGKRYCVCRRISGDPEGDEKIICPCYFHRQELEKDGRCLCGLFVK